MKKDKKAELEALRADMNKIDRTRPQSFENAKKLIIKDDGIFKLRILPSNADDSKAPFRLFKLHYYKNPNFPDNERPVPFVCAEKECPMCQHAFSVLKKEKAQDLPREKRQAWKGFAQNSAVYYVVDLSDGEVKQLSADKNYYQNGLHDLILQEINAKIDEGINVVDEKEGRVLVVERRTIDGKKRFSVRFEDEPHALSEKTLEELKKLKPISRAYWKNTVEELQMVLDGESWMDKTQKKQKEKAQSTESVIAEESLFSDDPEEESDIEDLKRTVFGPKKAK